MRFRTPSRSSAMGLIVGVLFIILGVNVILSGAVRGVVMLNDFKYLVGGVSILLGVYVVIINFKSSQ